MPSIIDMPVFIGETASIMRQCPTVTSEAAPVISWRPPDGFSQRRYSIRITSLEPGAAVLYQSGEVASANAYHQWPQGSPMGSGFLGLLAVEIALSQNAAPGSEFEWTTGAGVHKFVYDDVAERLYNRAEAALRWANSVDADPSQTTSYQTDISTDPSFPDEPPGTVSRDAPEMSGGFTSVNIPVTTGETYFWRVRAHDGSDWGPYSKINGFINSSSAPPSIDITGVCPTGNKDADVIVGLSISDPDSASLCVVMAYTGGNSNGEWSRMSMSPPLAIIPVGDFQMTWRSGRDETLVSASDYIIKARVYDESGSFDEDVFGPFALDNSLIGADQGGIGPVDMSFPLLGRMAIKTSADVLETPFVANSDISQGPIPSGFMACDAKGGLWSHRIYAVGPIVHQEEWLRFGYNKSGIVLDYPRGVSGGRLTEIGLGGASGLGDLDSGDAMFVKRTDLVGPDGHPPPVIDPEWPGSGPRSGYMRFLEVAPADRQPCPSCSGKGWRVQDLVSHGDELYSRIPCPVCGGSRFSDTPLAAPNRLMWYSKSRYEPVWDWVKPGMDHCGLAVPMASIRGLPSRFIVGEPSVSELVWPLPAQPATSGTEWQIDAPGAIPVARGGFPGRVGMAKIFESQALYRPFPSSISLGAGKIPMTGEDLPIHGAIGNLGESYVSGFSPSEADGFINRSNPTNRWERGIWRIEGNIHGIGIMNPLSILYLQGSWNSYNTIHWSSTASSVSLIHLQYCQLFDGGGRTEYVDVVSENSSSDLSTGYRMVEPNRWHDYWDNAKRQALAFGWDYRMRIRMYDKVSRTFSQWVYSPKFRMAKSAVNPPNILSVEFNPWTRVVSAIIRIDDFGEARYDVTGGWWSSDGVVFHKMLNGDMGGGLSNLSSKEGENIHVVTWMSSSASLDPGDSYRIRFEVARSDTSMSMDAPILTWTSKLNPSLSMAEGMVMQIAGHVQSFIYDPSTKQYEKQDPMVIYPGKMDFIKRDIDDMMSDPPPSGVHIYIDPSGSIADPSGYQGWMDHQIAPGVSRRAILANKTREYDNLRDTEYPYWIGVRDEAERATRKRLVNQGFYSNGFINGDPDLGAMKFRVMSRPQGSDAFDDDGEYIGEYASRYEAYSRVQLDFSESFDSQGGRPLRDWMFNENGQRISAGPPAAGEIETPDGTIDLLSDPGGTVYRWAGESAGAGPWDSNPGTDMSPTTTYTEPAVAEQAVRRYKIPINELPGEYVDRPVSDARGLVTDVLPSGVSSFEGQYWWRSASYNVLSGPETFTVHPVISSINTGGSGFVVSFYGFSAEEVARVNYSGIKFQNGTSAWTWTDVSEVSFPSDPPDGSSGQLLESVLQTPFGKNRSRPWVVRTRNHRYMMWYSKEDCYGSPCVVHARGGSPIILGEYGMSHPDTPATAVSEYLGADAIHSPSVFYHNDRMVMHMSASASGVNSVMRSESLDGDKWSAPSSIIGIPASGHYSPSTMVDEDGSLVTATCHLDGGSSAVALWRSEDGIIFSQIGSASVAGDMNTPCLVKRDGEYVMYCSLWSSGSWSIISMISSDLSSWTFKRSEIQNAFNPCVVEDYFGGFVVDRIYYNTQSGDDIRIKTAVLDNRTWTDWFPGTYYIDIHSITHYFAFGDTENLVFTEDGSGPYSITIIPNEGYPQIPSGSTSAMIGFSPKNSTREFLLQSEWVDEWTEAPTESSRSPQKLKYNPYIKEWKY